MKKAKQEVKKAKRRNGAYHREVIFEQAKKPGHYLGSIADRQTPEQRKERELAAKISVYRQQEKIAKALPTGEKCSQRACPYPAVLDGECRKHALDRTLTNSEFGSTVALAVSMSHILCF